MNSSAVSSRLIWSALLFSALVVGGLVTVGLGWRVAARTLVVAHQVPALVSGGLGGLALVVVGAGFLHVQLTRQWDADEAAAADRLRDEIEALTCELRAGR